MHRSRTAGCNRGGKETRFPVTPPVLQTDPSPARKINLFHLEWSVKDSRVKFCYFFFFLFLFFLLSERPIRRKERENSPIYPIFTRLALEYIASVTM